MFARSVFRWRHQTPVYDVIVGKKYFFSKGGNIIYRWKARITLILNHIGTMVWKWSPGEIFWFEVRHVTSRDKFEIEISPQDLIFSPWFLCDYESAKHGLFNDMWYDPIWKNLEEKNIFFLLCDHRPEFDDVTGKLTVQTFPIWFVSKENH